MTAKNAFENFIEERFDAHDDYDFFSSQSNLAELKEKILDWLEVDKVKDFFIDYDDTALECMMRAYALGFRDAAEIFAVRNAA